LKDAKNKADTRLSLPPPRGRVAPEGGRAGTKSRKRGATVQNEVVVFMKAAPFPAAGFPSPDPC
jgi:hypothetical protein